MEIKTVGILGAGTMGAGIAQVIIQAGYDVILSDVREDLVQKGLNQIIKNLQKAVEKGKVSPDEKNTMLTRLKGCIGLSELNSVDLVVEAIVENLELKKKVYTELDSVCPPHAILASNTSSLPISALGAATQRSHKVVGMHFFNPVPIMKLVEVIPGLETSQETVDIIRGFSETLSKVPIGTKEYPGFIVNRILVPMINEAVLAYQEGVGTAEDIDTAMKLGANLPMGPLALADLVGVDIVLAVMEVFHTEFADSKYRPALLLKQMVRAGHLGLKTGKGFYDYTKH